MLPVFGEARLAVHIGEGGCACPRDACGQGDGHIRDRPVTKVANRDLQYCALVDVLRDREGDSGCGDSEAAIRVRLV